MSPRGGEHVEQAAPDTVAVPAPAAARPFPESRAGGRVRLDAPGMVALQRTAGNRAVCRSILAPARATSSEAPRQLARAVRVDGGRTRLNEAKFTSGFLWWLSPFNWLAAALFNDPVKRVFADEAEFMDFLAAKTDHIGDVHTHNGDTFWFRLPKDKLTVLGEIHENPDGNVEDVITGLRTKRFKYEAFNEIVTPGSLSVSFTGTQTRLGTVNRQYPADALTDRARFDPDLENIVIKALTSTAVLRNEFVTSRTDAQWKARPSTHDYSFGERTALYTSMAIHIAADLAAGTIPAPAATDTAYIKAARALVAAYRADKAELDTFMATKDGDDLIGIFELTSPRSFANLPALVRFSRAFHEYGSRYIEQLGIDLNDATLKAEGPKLAANLRAGLMDFGDAREAIMWQKITAAAGFLLIGMGDAHRVSLKPKLDAASIPHARVDEELRRQKRVIDAAWVP